MHTVLFPSSAQALSFRRSHADSADPYSFATSVVSTNGWIADAWRLWGDGRSIATESQRLMAFLGVLQSAASYGLPNTVGMASLLVRLANEVLGSDEWSAVLEGSIRVGHSHGALIEAMRAYESLLSSVGLVDRGRACAVIAAQEDIEASDSLIVYDAELSAAQRKLAEALFSVVEYREHAESRIGKVNDDIRLRFAFPAGRYAEPALLLDEIQRYIADGPILMTSSDPYGLYEEIAPACDRQGIVCAVRARKPFDQTDFGRAYRAVCRIVDAQAVVPPACADFLLNPFSGISEAAAYEFDASLRGDRLITKESCLERLRGVSRSFEYFEELAESVDSDALLGYFEDRARSMRETEAYVAEQIAALSCMRECMAAARLMGLGRQQAASVLERARIDVSRSWSEGDCHVLIVDARMVHSALCREWPTVIMCNMDNGSFPVKNADDAAHALAQELGIARPQHALSDLRRSFALAAHAAKKNLVIERCLNDESADPTYPAATVEEFIDCYRVDPTDASEIDNAYALPECLMGELAERGEEALYENAAVNDGPQRASAVQAGAVGMHAIASEKARELLMLPRMGKRGVVVHEPCFSASQIESYLECPQKWFALRRLRLDDLDEGFGAMEMGDFSHGVLEDFYCRFQSEVASKVSAETLASAKSIMREVIEEHAHAQFEKRPSNTRLVPVTVFEQREMEELAEKLIGYLDREAMLLPGFSPYALEYEIPVEHAVDYAGCKLIGKIDRIDVDERGRAIIIDYKSSLSADYDLYELDKSKKAVLREGKVQALIYAQAVRRVLGFDVVGALYVGYGRLSKVSGALSCDIEPQHVPGLRAETCVYRGDFGEGFTSLLDATEARIASSLEKLMGGRIEPAPVTAHACAYCPEISCPQRRG